MTFLESVVAISKRPDLELCDDENELNGVHPCICVYKGADFVGKLRWPKDGEAAYVDDGLVWVLEHPGE